MARDPGTGSGGLKPPPRKKTTKAAVRVPSTPLVPPPTNTFRTATQTLVAPTPLGRKQASSVRARAMMDDEVRSAVQAPPDVNLKRYGFAAAAQIERAKEQAAHEAALAREPRLEAHRGPIKTKTPQSYTGFSPEQARAVKRVRIDTRAQDILTTTARMMTVGPDLAKAMRGERYDPRWAFVDLVMAPLSVTGAGPLRSGWAGVRAIQGLRAVSRPAAEVAVRNFRSEEARAVELAGKAARGELTDVTGQVRQLTLRERRFINAAVRARPAAAQLETAIGRAKVLARAGYGERPIVDYLIPSMLRKTPWTDVIRKGMRDVKVGDRVAVDVEHDLVGPHRQEGVLVEAGKSRIKYLDDEDRVHSLPYGRVIWAGSPATKPPHGLELPSFEEALSRLGTARPADEVSQGIAKDVIESGLPLPERLMDHGELSAAVDRVFELAREGANDRDWYVRAAASAENVYQHYREAHPETKLDRSQVAQLMAIFSTGNDPTPNMKHVIDALDQYVEHGRVLKAGMYPEAQTKEANAVMRGEGWTGRKRNSFYANMLRHLDPDAYARLQAETGRSENPVTVDMWVVRMFAPWEKRDVPAQYYDAFEQLLTRMAHEYGWDPEEIQAAAWVAAKARGIIGGEIRRGAATGNVRRATTYARAYEKGADAYETGVRKYLRGRESAAAERVRTVVGDSGTRPAREDLAGVGGVPGRDAGDRVPLFTEVKPTRTGARQFIDALRRNPRQWSLSEPSQARLRNSRSFLAEGGEAGFSIHMDGELHAVFKNPGGPKGWGYEAAIESAHRGAYWLNVFDIPAVRRGYEAAGFVEVARIPFNPEYAPKGVEEVGTPDVVFMALGARPHPVRSFDDWDTAVAYTRELARPATPAKDLARPGFEVQQPISEQLAGYRETARSPVPEHAMGIFGRGRELPPELPDPAELRAQALREAADDLRAWKLANPYADKRLERDMVGQIARHNGLDEWGLHQYLVTGEIKKATSQEEAVVEAMPAMKRVRSKQDKLVSVERARRATVSSIAYEKAGGGLAGHAASLKALEGEMPRLTQTLLDREVLSDEGIHQLFQFISTQKHLGVYEQIRARKALLDMTNGVTLQPNQIKLLTNVFGETIPTVVRDSVQSIPHALLNEIWNLPRALMSSMDMSAPFRQGLVSAAGHPKIFARNFVGMFKALSKAQYRKAMDEIIGRDTFDLMLQAKLSLPDVTDHLTSSEVYFFSNLGMKIPLVAASQRAYLMFLNKMRADVFDSMLRTAEAEGIDLTETVGRTKNKRLKDIAHYVNVATGRGDLDRVIVPIKLEKAAEPLAKIFFAPRLWASRLNLLDPRFYADLDPFVRKQAVTSALTLLGAGSTVAGLAALAGANVSLEPRSADFGKIRIGNSRLDIWGGFQQNVRFIAQFGSGTYISSTTGKRINLGEGGYGKMTRFDIAERFARGKSSPTMSVLWDWMRAQTYNREPVDFRSKATWLREIKDHTVPLLWQDMNDVQDEYGPAGVIGLSIPGTFGVGVQTYTPKPPPRRVPHVRAPSSGGMGGSFSGGMGSSGFGG